MQKRPKNHVLESLNQSDFDALLPDLQAVTLPARKDLQISSKDVEHIYFLESGAASVMARDSQQRQLEIGVIGREGMTGLEVALGDFRAANSISMIAPGHGVRIPVVRLKTAIHRSDPMRTIILRYASCFMTTISQAAVANRHGNLEERLARHLLMISDRLEEDHFALTLNLLAFALGVGRASISVAIGTLEKKTLIKKERFHLKILDRTALKAAAGASYGISEIEFRRLTNWRAGGT
jgi:CRP-like cAMP-binding protein